MATLICCIFAYTYGEEGKDSLGPSLIFFGIKLVFLVLHTVSNVNVLHKVLLLQDWVFRLGVGANMKSVGNQNTSLE